jgi:hypothetical protein
MHYTLQIWSLQLDWTHVLIGLWPTSALYWKKGVKMPIVGGCPWRCMMVCNTDHPHNRSPRRHSREQHHRHVWTMQHSFNAHTCTRVTTALDSHPIPHPTCGQQTKTGKPPTISNPHLNTHQNHPHTNNKDPRMIPTTWYVNPLN